MVGCLAVGFLPARLDLIAGLCYESSMIRSTWLMSRSRSTDFLNYAFIVAALVLVLLPATEAFEPWTSGGLDGEIIQFSTIVLLLAGLLLVGRMLSRPLLGLLMTVGSRAYAGLPAEPLRFPVALPHSSPAILRI
jgi:hypothetical protein